MMKVRIPVAWPDAQTLHELPRNPWMPSDASPMRVPTTRCSLNIKLSCGELLLWRDVLVGFAPQRLVAYP